MLGDPGLLPSGDAVSLPSWSYVGTQFLCGAHEGYAGETVAWLANITTDVVAKNDPDIILFQAGTNDFFWPPPRGSRSPSEVADRLRGLLNHTFSVRPDVTFLISTVTTIDVERCKTYHSARWHPGDCPQDMQSNIAAYNKLLPGIIAEYRARGHDIALHDVNTDAHWTEADRWIWGIHFNSSGFQKMAASWHKALMASVPMRRSMGLAGMNDIHIIIIMILKAQ